MKWYAKKTNAGSAHEQGLIADEETGRSVAVCYDSKDMSLIAAAPDMLKALQLIVTQDGVLTKSDWRDVHSIILNVMEGK